MGAEKNEKWRRWGPPSPRETHTPSLNCGLALLLLMLLCPPAAVVSPWCWALFGSPAVGSRLDRKSVV